MISTPGSGHSGAPTPHVVDAGGRNVAVLFQLTRYGDERLLLLDVATGEELAFPGDDENFLSTSFPGDCSPGAGTTTDVVEVRPAVDAGVAGGSGARPVAEPTEGATCFTALTDYSQEADRYLRVDLTNGLVEVSGVAEAVALPDAMEVGQGFWISYPRGTEDLIYLDEGEVRWRTSYEKVFGKGYSMNYGRSWSLDDAQRIFMGTAFTEDQDLARAVTVALDRASGEVVWTKDGASTCSAGQYSGEVLCVVPETRRDPSGGSDDPSGHLDIDLVRVDPATGEEMWTVPLGDSPNAFHQGEGTAVTAPSQRWSMVLIDEVPHLVDQETGRTKDISDWTGLACAENIYFSYREWPDPTLDPIERYGGTVMRFCDTDGGEPATALVTPELLDFAAMEIDGIRVLALADGLNGYTVD